MTAIIIILGVTALIGLVLLTCAGFHIIAENGDVRLYFTFGILKFLLLPKKEKRVNYKKIAKKLKGKRLSDIKPDKKKTESGNNKKKKVKFPRTGNAVDDLVSAVSEMSDDPESVKVLLTALRELSHDFGNTLHFELNRFNVKIDTGNAAVTSVLCGGITAALSLTLEFLDRKSRLVLHSPEKISIIPSYSNGGSDIAVDMKISMKSFDLISGIIKSFAKNNIKIIPQKKGQKK